MIPRESTEPTIFKTRGPLDPVTDNKIIAPRPELDQLERAAQAPRVDAYFAILGSRQTGKTTLLYQLHHRLRPRGYGVALLDLASVRDQPEQQLYHFVADELRTALAELLPPSALKPDAPLPSNPAEFRQFLLNLARQARTTRIVILLDEADAVAPAYANAFYGMIRGVHGGRHLEDEIAFGKYLFVLAGATEVNRLTNGPNSPLNIATRVFLEDLTLASVQMLVNNFTRSGISAPPETAQWLYDQASGHPYLTQRLCQLIELEHPATITLANVQRATDEILRSDDHLAKLIYDVNENTEGSAQLRKIVAGTPTPFSRVNALTARLELIGAIREHARQCQVRNAIYRATLQAQWSMSDPPKPAPKRFSPIALIAAILALIVFSINIPLLVNYTRDMILTPADVSDEIRADKLGARAVIKYNSVLHANDGASVPINIQVTDFVTNTSLFSVFRTVEPDILLEGSERLGFPSPKGGKEQYNFLFKAHALPYNPFDPTTPHRRVDLVFNTSAPDKPVLTYTADFRVDYYSSAVMSFFVSIGSIATFIGALATQIQRIRDGLKFLFKITKVIPDQ